MAVNYIKIKEEISSMIQSGRLKSGEKLPSEIKMARAFGVSRETFRSAVKLLEQEGRVIIKRGAGTYIVDPLPHIPNRLEHLGSVTNMIQSAGLKEGEKRESIQSEASSEEWAEMLQLTPGDPVIVNERVRTAEDEPVIVSKNIISEQLTGREILETDSIGSLFLYLEQQCGIYITSADSEIHVPLHTDRNCQKLLICPETTVLLLKQIHYNHLNIPVLYSMDYFRNDIFTFSVRRTRD